MRGADLNEAALHLATAMMLFRQGLFDDRASRTGLKCIHELAGSALAAHRSGEPIEKFLSAIVGNAEQSTARHIAAGSRFDAVCTAINSMRACLHPAAEAPPRSSLGGLQ